MSKGAELIMMERRRQIEEEGFIAEQDDMWKDGELGEAAACYLMDHDWAFMEDHWPFAYTWWKPKDRTSNLVRAGALIAAELDRLLRQEPEDGD